MQKLFSKFFSFIFLYFHKDRLIIYHYKTNFNVFLIILEEKEKDRLKAVRVSIMLFVSYKYRHTRQSNKYQEHYL